MKKLTLSADPTVIRKARRLARKNKTTISAMFARFIRLMDTDDAQAAPISPIARKASGMLKLPKGKTDRAVLEEALEDKYGLKR